MNRRQPSTQYVQFCARCYGKWPVVSGPADWCPRCGGVLLAPSAKDTPPEHRNFLWVARLPGRRGGNAKPVARPQTPTPHYTSTPSWGLEDSTAMTEKRDQSRIDSLAGRVNKLLLVTAVLFALAAVAELGRYAILIYNRTRLVDSILVWISDIAVWTFAIAAPLVGVYAAVACTAWLIKARRAHYARQKAADPRTAKRIAIGTLVPGVNVVMPGVLLNELTSDSAPRIRKLARLWWIAWAASVALALFALLWRRADSLQAMADGVLLYAWTDLAAAGMAVFTLALIRAIEGRSITGKVHTVHRWVPATGPARDVIEPIRPVASTAKDSSAHE